jgi:type II secretory pathway component PulK
MKGAINLNTAPAEVLMMLPQMTEEVAQAIVAYRDANPLMSRGDLLRVETVTPAIFNAIIERVTVVSDSYLVRALGTSQVVMPGSGRTSDISVHLTAVVDRTTGRCRIVRLRQDN